MFQKIFQKIRSKFTITTKDYNVLPSESPYFNNIKCSNCGHTERVPFNVANYRCDKCKNIK